MIPDVCDIQKRKNLVDYDAKISIVYKTIEEIEKKRDSRRRTSKKRKNKTMIVSGNIVRASRI
jgi:hypothetical protein